MKVIHLEASKGWGGQEMRILHEAIGMRNKGHTIFFAVEKGAKLAIYARRAGFCVYELFYQRRYWMISLFYLLFLLKKQKIDLINTHSSLDAWLGGIAGRILGKKIIRTRHLSTPIRKGWNSRILYKGLADFVVTTCKKMQEVILSQASLSSYLCRSIPTGVDPSLIQYEKGEEEKFRQMIGIDPTDFLVGSACIVRSWKGIDVFLKAAALLSSEKDIHWVIVGDGYLEQYLQMVKTLHLEKRVTLCGFIEHPYAAISSFDLFVLLSTKNEGVSQASLQAAYLKKPLITTSIGGLAEVCIDGVTGSIVEPNDPAGVAHAVLELKKDKEKRKQMGEAAHQHVLENFTFQKTIDQMQEVYSLLASDKS